MSLFKNNFSKENHPGENVSYIIIYNYIIIDMVYIQLFKKYVYIYNFFPDIYFKKWI